MVIIGRFIDLTGQVFGRLTVMCRVATDKKATIWRCKCECGNEVSVQAGHLKDGHTMSCGCYHSAQLSERNNRHGMSHTRLYNIWSNMKERCEDPEHPKYPNYGGRGIKLCDEWHDSATFFEWAIENGYEENLTIDRIDVNGDYNPNNCRWVGTDIQSLNRTDNHYLTLNNKTQTMKEWSIECNIPYSVLEARINRYQWDIERALITPVKHHGYSRNS